MKRKTTDMPEIGIVETKKILREIQQKYGYDFSQYSPMAFRFALDNSIMLHHLKYPELLSSRILEDDDFFDEFLFEITDTHIELFRDPETWKVISRDVIPELLISFTKPQIWFPGASNGQDLFSFLILLQIVFPKLTFEAGISCIAEKTISRLSGGIIPLRQIETSIENFEKIFPENDIYKYIKNNGKDYAIDHSLLKNVSFFRQNLNFESVPSHTNLLFFRNNLLVYTPEHKEKVLDQLISIIDEGGFFITGIKDNLDDYISNKKNLTVYNSSEKIFRKIKT